MSTFTLRTCTPADVAVYRDVRLAALADAPSAFGSTHASEAARDEGFWHDRLARCDGRRGVTVLAFADDQQAACGLATGVFETATNPAGRPGVAWLLSMWVGPDVRRNGLGRRIVEAIVGWARQAEAEQLLLHVTLGNEGAERLYTRCGFVRTGRLEPHPVYAGVMEAEMRLLL
ncbi:MAG: GNAT family N-acetyltransferase [Phycisphaerae bacterium]